MKCSVFCGVIALAVTVLAPSALAEPVHLRVDTVTGGQEYGAGISVGKGRECFIVTPYHVVELATTITVTDRSGKSAVATRYQAPDGVDVALLKLPTDHPLDCPEDWDDGASGDSQLYEADFLISRKVKQRGLEQRRFFLASATSGEVSVQPFSQGKANKLREGDSGSSLYANNALVGMIVNVDTATGSGTAIRQSMIHALFSDVILEKSTKVAFVEPVLDRRSENRYATLAVRDFLAEKTVFDVRELPSSQVARNRSNVQRGMNPTYPDGADYVFRAAIIDTAERTEANSNYKPGADRTENIGRRLRYAATNRDFRQYHVSSVDVEVTIVQPRQDRVFSHIASLSYKVALRNDVTIQDVRKQVSEQATVEAVEAAMDAFGMHLIDEQPEEAEGGILGLLFKKND